MDTIGKTSNRLTLMLVVILSLGAIAVCVLVPAQMLEVTLVYGGF